MGIGSINVSRSGSIYERGPAWDEMAVRQQGMQSLADGIKSMLSEYGKQEQLKAERGLMVDLSNAKSPDEIRAAIQTDRSPQSWFGRVAQSQVPGGGQSDLRTGVLGKLLERTLADPAKTQLLQAQARKAVSEAGQAEFKQGRMTEEAELDARAKEALINERNAQAASKGGNTAERARLAKIAKSLEDQIESFEFDESKAAEVQVLRQQLDQVYNAINSLDGGITKDEQGNLVIDTPEKLAMISKSKLDAGVKLSISEGLLSRGAASEPAGAPATSPKSAAAATVKPTGQAPPAPRPEPSAGSPLSMIEQEAQKIKVGQAKKAREDAAWGGPEIGTSGQIKNLPMPHPLIGYPEYPSRRPSYGLRRNTWQ